jgi:hypothetical protein
VKRAFSIFFLILFLSQYLIKLSIVINFNLFQEEIIAKCCVNKNRPELECYGKCYLQKQIRTVDNNNIPLQNNGIKKFHETDLFIIEDTDFIHTFYTNTLEKRIFSYFNSFLIDQNALFGLLKPPQMIG